jgi:hypothetical protein
VSEELRAILDFVEGRINARQFESILYGGLERFKAFFSYNPNPPRDQQDFYLFLIVRDYGDPEDVVRVQEALTDYLNRAGISFTTTTQHANLFEILQAAQPEWLNVDTAWLQEAVLPEAGNRKGDDLRQWLEHRLRKLFTYRKTPPEWLQSPEWPIGPKGPLIFLGSLDTDNYLCHGEVIYVFYDAHDGTIEAVIQSVG